MPLIRGVRSPQIRAHDPLLFRWRPGDFRPDEVFSRASVAKYSDSGLILQEAASGVLRNAHFQSDGTRSARLEAERTNELLQSEDFTTTWINSGAAPVANQAVAPDGAMTADFFEDNNATVFENINQARSVANDAVARAVSLFVKKNLSSTGNVGLELKYTGGTQVTGRVDLDPSNGTIGPDNAVDAFGVEDEGDYWRVWMANSNNGTGNTIATVTIYPTVGTVLGTPSASAQGTQHIWGAQLELGSFPSSYNKTTTVAATRAADSLSYDFLHAPQAMTVYAKFVERGFSDGDYVWATSDGSSPRLFCRKYGGGYRIRFIGAEDVFVSPSDPGVIGDSVELLATFQSSGVQITSSINGAVQVASAQSAPLTMPAAWGAGQFHLGESGAATLQGFSDHIALKAARLVQTMEAMRAA